MIAEHQHDPIRSGAELVLSRTEAWLTPRDITSGLVVLIHGFTSHGRYMRTLAKFLEGWGFCSATFNYDSYYGIDQAATDLSNRLKPLHATLSTNGFALIAHSMGGLVARYFARHRPSVLESSLKGIVTLGTPHQGTLADQRLVSAMLDWGEWLTLPHPYARSTLCRSSQQLTLQDPEQLVTTLNEQDRLDPPDTPQLSISGGRRFLEFGSKGRAAASDIVRNKMLQKLLGPAPNDGLVQESSANLLDAVGPADGRISHRNDYADHGKTNHTHLTRNQELAILVAVWLTATARLRSVNS